MAARSLVCFFSGMDAQRASRGRVAVLAAALFLLTGPNFPAFCSLPHSTEAQPTNKKTSYLLHVSLNEHTLEEKIEDHLGAEAQSKSDQAQRQEFVERIDWEGN